MCPKMHLVRRPTTQWLFFFAFFILAEGCSTGVGAFFASFFFKILAARAALAFSKAASCPFDLAFFGLT